MDTIYLRAMSWSSANNPVMRIDGYVRVVLQKAMCNYLQVWLMIVKWFHQMGVVSVVAIQKNTDFGMNNKAIRIEKGGINVKNRVCE